MVRELGCAAKKFAGLKASDAISKRGNRGARLRTGWVGTQGCLVIHKNTLDGNGSGLAEASHLRNDACFLNKACTQLSPELSTGRLGSPQGLLVCTRVGPALSGALLDCTRVQGCAGVHPVLGELGRTWANLGERAQAGRAMRPRRSPSIVPVSENVMALRAELASKYYWATGLYWAYWTRRC